MEVQENLDPAESVRLPPRSRAVLRVNPPPRQGRNFRRILVSGEQGGEHS